MLLCVGCNKNADTPIPNDDSLKLEVNEEHVSAVGDLKEYSNSQEFSTKFAANDNEEVRNFVLDYLNTKYKGHNFTIVNFIEYNQAFTDVKPLYQWKYTCKDENSREFIASAKEGTMWKDVNNNVTVQEKYLADLTDNYAEIFYRDYLEDKLQVIVREDIGVPCVVSLETLKNLNTNAHVWDNAWEFLKKESGITIVVLVKTDVTKETQQHTCSILEDKVNTEWLKFYKDKTDSFNEDKNYSDLKHKLSEDYVYFTNNSTPLY